jgi:hypothetical protein
MGALDKETNWSIAALPQIEKRVVNKELETKRVLVNFILVLVLRLVENFTKLILLKLDSKWIDLDQSSAVWYLRAALNLLFVYNIGSGIYNVVKPRDEFADLDLSSEQRVLLGLPALQDQKKLQAVKDNGITLSRIEPQTSTQYSNVLLSPKKTAADQLSTANRAGSNSTTKVTSNATTTSTATTGGSLQPTTPSKNRTPIASPMSSPSPIRPLSRSPAPKHSASKSSSIATSTSTSSPLKNKFTANPLLQKSSAFAPTYIPSPKYYYRMDSPTKTRRI